MGLARPQMRRLEAAKFWKLCGSGTGEGFTPIPNTGVYAILAVWPDLDTARAQCSDAAIYRKYMNHSQENWTVFLEATSSRGSWAGSNPFDATTQTTNGPIAVLTRATVRPLKALGFWRRVPNISAVIGADKNVAFKIGIGEVPLLHQVTFSIWPDTQSMAAFARKDGPHARAIQAVRDGNWFREELYARFSVIETRGSWHGHSPLAGLGIAA